MDRRVTDTPEEDKGQSGLPKFFEGYAVQTSPFGDNVSGEQAYKRAERIAAALYLVTNHMSEREPLRSHVRECAGALLESVLSFDVGLHSAGDHNHVMFLARVRESISLLRTLHVAGFVSSQNVDILMRACDALGQFVVRARDSTLSEQVSLTREDLLPRPPSTSEAATRSTSGIAAAPRQQSARSTSRTRETGGRQKPKAAQKHSQRRDTIIGILRKSGPLGIKDIAAQIPDCSEKTVQRELAALAEQGSIRASGEKRWRTYALV